MAAAGRPIVLAVGVCLAVALIITAIIERDPAGAFAAAAFAFLVAVACDAMGLRRRLPSVGGPGRAGALATITFYFVVMGLAYGVVAEIAPQHGSPNGPGSGAWPAPAGVNEQPATRPSLSVVSPEEPSFMATVVRVLGPSTVVLDGDEPADLAGVPELSTLDPAYSAATKTLEDLVLGRAVTVDAVATGPPVAGRPRRLLVTLTVRIGPGQARVVNQAVLLVIESTRRERP